MENSEDSLLSNESSRSNSESSEDKSSKSEDVPIPKTCRICLCDDISQGNPLISPCKCKGTMKYVHLKCLEEWRRVSGRNTSFYRCDQCHFNYRMSRISLYNILTHEIVISAVTILIFLILVIVCGYVGRMFFSDEWFSSLFYDDFNRPITPHKSRHFKSDETGRRDKTLHKVSVSDEWELSMDPNSWAYHMLLGSIIVGLMSFVHMGIFFNFNFGWGRRGGGDFSGLVIILALIGVIRSLYLIHEAVRTRVRTYGMALAGSMVLDIGDSEND